MTPDARFIVFSSKATNLPGANGNHQIYRFEQGTSSTGGVLLRVSTLPNGNPADFDCLMPSISNDGKRIVFHTQAKLVTSDTDVVQDVYLVDLTNPSSPTTTWVSAAHPGAGVRVRGNSVGAAISGNGLFVAFTSAASDLLPSTNTDVNQTTLDVFRYTVADGTNELVSLNNAQGSGKQSSKPFSTIGDDLMLCPANVGDLRVGRVISDDGTRVLMHGTPCDWFFDDNLSDPNPALCPDPSGDPRVACSDSPNCTNGFQQVYLRDFNWKYPGEETGFPVTFMVSRAAVFVIRNDPPPDCTCDALAAGDACSRRASISGDGSRIAFSSFAKNYRFSVENCTLPDTDNVEEVFFKNTQDVIGEVCLQPTPVSTRRCGAPEGISDNDSFQPVLSANGGFIAFASKATNLISVTPCSDTNGKIDVFIRNMAGGGTTRRFSVDSNGVQADDDSSNPDISGNGTIALYHSLAINLLGPLGDRNNLQDIFQSPAPQGPFIRGDVDLNGKINLTDSIRILNWLFQGGPPPGCYDSADADDDSRILQNDATYLNNFLFSGGPAPKCPFCCGASPAFTSCCGKDPTGDGLPCGVTLSGCTQFSSTDGSCPPH